MIARFPMNALIIINLISLDVAIIWMLRVVLSLFPCPGMAHTQVENFSRRGLYMIFWNIRAWRQGMRSAASYTFSHLRLTSHYLHSEWHSVKQRLPTARMDMKYFDIRLHLLTGWLLMPCCMLVILGPWTKTWANLCSAEQEESKTYHGYPIRRWTWGGC